jgi:hypothetical protein
MFIAAAAMIIGTTVQVIGKVKAGKAAKEESLINAQQMETDKQLSAIQASQAHVARARQFEEAVSTNEAFFAFSGRDVSDMSVKAFLERQKDVYTEDQVAGGIQANADDVRRTVQIGAEKRRGKNALVAGYLGATASAASGAYKYKTNK